MPTYDVFREENRAGGSVDHLGTVKAHDAEQAQREAEAQFECHKYSHLYVRLQEADNAESTAPQRRPWTLAEAATLLIGRWEQERDFERKMWLEAEINELGQALNLDTVERLSKSGDKNMVDHMRDTLERIAVEYPSAVEMCDCGDRPGYACPKCEIAFLLKEWTQTEDFRAGTD